MAFNPKPDHGTLMCDECGEELMGFEEYVLFGTEADLEVAAREAGWTTDGHLWSCSNCPQLIARLDAGEPREH